MTDTGAAKSENVFIDLLKAFFALAILALHTDCFGRYDTLLMPIYRMGVPFFFVIGSYFFFKKVNKTPNKKQKYVLSQYIKRNLLLYVFWFVCSLPFVYQTRYAENFENGFLNGVFLMLKSMVFGSTWKASWYIMAAVIGTMLIYFLSRFIKNNLLFLLSLAVYLFCCACCTWYGLFADDGFIPWFLDLYKTYTTATFYNSFPVSLIWIMLGKIFAEQKVHIKLPYIWLIGSIVLLFAESYLVQYFGIQDGANSDAYLMLLPVIALLVYVALYKNVFHFSGGKFLRAYSVVVYCSQGIWAVLITGLYAHFGWSGSTWLNFAQCVIAAVCSLLLTAILLAAQKCRTLRFLKYAY